MSDPIRRASPEPPQRRADADRLHAYHDGELSRFARWRFERRLLRSVALRRELDALARVGEWVRDSHVDAPGPDLWEAIALRLPAADARRADAASPARARGFGWLAWPGLVATAVLAAFVGRDWLVPEAPPPDGVVRWLDSGWRDVLVLEAPDTTIIWVFDAPSSKRNRGGGDGSA